jgi:hypothetical protein
MRRSLILMLLLPLLPGCLYIELTGNVVGAQVSITPLRGGAPVVSGLRTTDVDDLKQLRGAREWASYNDLVKLLSVGYVKVPTDNLVDTRLYLVTAQGGRDMDWDANRRIDGEGTVVEGSLHAIVSGAQLKQDTLRVNLLTDAIYRLVEPELKDLGRGALLRRLDELAADAVPDVDGNGQRDYADALAWSQLQSDFPFPGNEQFLRRAELAIAWDLDADILALNAENLIQRADWAAALPAGRYGEQLVECTTPVLVRDLCDFQTLPLIGQDTRVPRIADIMSRVVVTHDWMRHRFEQVLRRVPQDIRLLFRSVSAIVIGDDIRPSYFDGVTAAIYLDAGTLWVTGRERESVSTEEDYRQAFAKQVNFAANWRYMKESEPAFGDVDENGNANIDDVAKLMASLLFHELAHAADAIPPGRLSSLQNDQTPRDVRFTLRSELLSDNYPLRAAELFGLAGVLFGGFPPTPQEATYSASEVGRLFDPDGATDLYAYFTPREDLAMLFEEAMMAIHYGIRRDVAFTTLPDEDIVEPACSDYRVGWGMRGRIATPQLEDRVRQVLGELLPERDYSFELANLPVPLLMDTSRDWCENRVLGEEAQALLPLQRAEAGPGLGGRRTLH